MASEGTSREAGATDVTINPPTLRIDRFPRLLFGILLLRLGNSYPPWRARYDFCLIRVRQQADPFEEFDQDVERRLEPHRTSRSDQPVVHEKRDAVIANQPPNTVPSDVISQHLLEPLPYDTVDTNIEHEAGERSPLRNASIGSEGHTIIAPSTTNHLRVIPEPFLQIQQIWTHPVASQDLKASPPIEGVISLPQIQINLVEGLLINPRKLLLQLYLHDGCPRAPFRKSAVEAIVELDD